jgi:hypothetical protein
MEYLTARSYVGLGAVKSALADYAPANSIIRLAPYTHNWPSGQIEASP